MTPKGSCAACRARKKRCDKAIPACGQCVRLRQKCPGYREREAFVFKNQTPVTLENALKASPAQTDDLEQSATLTLRPASDPEQSLCAHALFTPPSDSPEQSAYRLSPQVSTLTAWQSASAISDDDIGISFFLNNYVNPYVTDVESFCDHAVHFLISPDPHCPVYSAVQAVGLAGLANTLNDETLLQRARTQYGVTIERIKTALHSPAEMVKDSTVAAIIVLSVYESLSSAEQEAEDAWVRHIEGATSIIIARGPGQLQTPLGLNIFRTAVAQLLVSYSRLRRRVPPRIRLLRNAAAPLVSPDDLFWALCSAHVQVLDLDLDADLDTQSDWESLLLRALDLDAVLDMAMTHPAEQWKYETVPTPPGTDKRLVYGDRMHLYPSLHVAKVWTGLRSTRLQLAKIIIRVARKIPEGQDGVYAAEDMKALERIIRFRDDTLASVPDMIGLVRRHADGTIEVKPSIERTTGTALGSFFVLWHLYAIGHLRVSTPETKAWIVDRLRAIRTLTGIAKASNLADSLEAHQSL